MAQTNIYDYKKVLTNTAYKTTHRKYFTFLGTQYTFTVQWVHIVHLQFNGGTLIVSLIVKRENNWCTTDVHSQCKYTVQSEYIDHVNDS